MARVVKQKHGGELHEWEPGESGNPKGRPRKLVSKVLKALKESGVERISASEVAEAMETLPNLSGKELVELGMDEEQPYMLRLIAKELLDSNGWKVLQDMLDRAHGKSKTNTDDGFEPPPTDEESVEIELPGGKRISI